MATGVSDDEVVEDDVALLRATRAGDATAYGRLYERHAGAALVVARQYTDSTADAEDVVSDAFAKVHGALLNGHGPEAAFRAYLFTVVRRVAAVQRTAGRRAEPTDDLATLETASTPVETAEEPTLAGFERSVVARAFRSLPERWQEVLWHSEVEGLTPAQIAPIVGLTANSTAALAYRAREGLRQAYLQHHLQDPLEDGCRAVAGKLGAHVRGGLATRDTRNVEQHLDACGDCRALVLELGDVSHGMRGVVAPLVLGLIGLGALRHELPVGGGLAAGAAALASGGMPASAGAGASAGGGAGGGAAGGAAAGSSVGGAAAGGGVVAGGGGLLAGVSAGVVATVIAAAVVVAAAVVGVVQLMSGPGDGVAAPTPGVSGASVTAPASPTATPATSRPASPSPGATTPGALPDDDAQDEVQDEPRADARGDDGRRPRPDRARSTTPRPAPAAPVVAPDPGPPAATTSAPTTAPTAGPTTAPTAVPTAEPAPEPGPADVVVAAPAGGISLTAGARDQAISLSVRNDGGAPAGGLVAEVELPAGTTAVRSRVVTARFGFAPVDVAGWSCVTSDGGAAATCTLDELPPGQGAELALGVEIDESYVASGDEAVRVRVLGAGRTWEPAPIRVHVAASLPRLAFGPDVPADVQLVVGRTRTLDLPVRNAGGTAVQPDAPATVAVVLPPGVSATGAAPWRCARVDDTLRCRHAALAAFEPAVLRLTLSSPSDAAPGAGSMRVRLTPSAHRDAETHDLGYALVRPAVLTVDAPAAVGLTPGTPVDLPVTVSNDGDLTATAAVLTVTAPAGATVVGAAGDGWRCAADGAAATCTADLAAGARGALTVRLDAAPGVAGRLGDATVTVAATDADATAGSRTVTLSAAAPTLTVTELTAVVDTGRTGTVAFAVTSRGADAADVVASAQLPPGVTHEPRPASRTTCTAVDSTVTCALGRLVADAPAVVEIPVRAAGAVLGAVDVRVTAAAAEPATASTRLVVASANLTPVWTGTGDLDVTEVGAPLLQCADADGRPCAAVRLDRDNNGLDMRPLDQVPPDGARADVPVSSQTHLDVPDERPVVWAGLYWSGVRGTHDAWSGPLDTARLRAPDGTWSDVTAAAVTQTSDSNGRRYYQATVDVTDLVARGGSGTWALADAAVSAGRSDRDPSYYAGWSLVVVHGTPAPEGAAGASTVTVHQGASWIGTNSTAPAFVFVGEAGARTRIGVVAWDGDRGTTGDRLTLAGVGALTPLRWDGRGVVAGGSSTNALDSTATGWEHPNSLGVDAKGFAEVTLPSGVGALTASTAGDQYLIGAVTVRTTSGGYTS